MRKGMTWRVGVILGVLLLAIVYLLPNFSGAKDSQFGRYLPDSKINLGLDLMGGIYLTLGVDVDKAMENTMTQTVQQLRSVFQSEGVLMAPRLMSDKKTLQLTLGNSADKDKAEAILKDKFGHFKIDSVQENSGKLNYTLSMSQEEQLRHESVTLDQALKTIRNRIDQFGVSEPDIRKQASENRIILQLPGIKDSARAIQIVGQTAHLEFHIVNTNISREDIAKGLIPADSMLLPSIDRAAAGQIAVYREVMLTGEYIDDASQRYDKENVPCVQINFNRQGAEIFERITKENTGKTLAIVLDGKVHSAPNIREPIAGGIATVTGKFTVAEAGDLALVLRAGSLPAPVTVLEERTVGPTLGKESIEKGVKAAVLGGIVVVAFMIIYYSMSGLIASSMLILDILLLLAGMGALGATLTLPGIAGIVLTLGMAVDANVLIYERIREEMGKGLSPRSAIEVGFSKATLTIMDSNITTVIAAVILYQFGTGPVRGFAVTLTLGIIVSMFTAIFVSRVVFAFWKNNKSKTLSI